MHDKRLTAYNLGLLRDDFPRGGFGMPKGEATQTVPKNVVGFNKVLSDKTPDEDTYVHFFIDDYQFERVWKSPARYVEPLKRYAGIIAPDFSVYNTMPVAMQIWNTYRNRWLAAYFAEQGIRVIPSANWGDEKSYDFCFEGLPQRSTVVISSSGGLKQRVSKWHFINGLHEMIKRLEPTALVVYGQLPEHWIERFPNTKIIAINSLTKSMRSRIMNGQR